MGFQRIQLGTLYANGQALDTRKEDLNTTAQWDQKSGVGIKDTVAGKAIQWVKPDGMNLLVADRVLLTCVRWNDLQDFGFTSGKMVDIDGRKYFCRLLQVGDRGGTPNEWDRIVDATGGDDELWHWSTCFFWGFDAAGNNSRACRGYYSARQWSCNEESLSGVRIGFRPVLELACIGIAPYNWVAYLEGQNFAVTQLAGLEEGLFLPQLIPFNKRVFSHLGDGEELRMYTLLCGGKPVRQGKGIPVACEPEASLLITDKFYGEEYLIPWVVSNGIAVAARPIISGTSAFGLEIQH